MSISGPSDGLRSLNRPNLGDTALSETSRGLQDFSCGLLDMRGDASKVFQQVSDSSSKETLPGGFTSNRDLLTQLGFLDQNGSLASSSVSDESARVADAAIQTGSDSTGPI